VLRNSDVPPPEHVEATPDRPSLKVLCWSGEQLATSRGISVPVDLVKSWAHHDVFGVRFREWLDRHVEEFGQEIMDEVKAVAVTGAGDRTATPLKRPHDVIASPPASWKRARADTTGAVNVDDLPGVEMVKA